MAIHGHERSAARQVIVENQRNRVVVGSAREPFKQLVGHLAN